MDAVIRPGRPDDRIAPLIYLAAPTLYDRYLDGPERALAVLDALTPLTGHAGSHEVAAVAECGRRPVGVMAGFPVADEGRLSRRFLALAARRIPATHWPALARCVWWSGRVSPAAPADAWYVDTLAVAPGHRRRGIARGLLAEAERRARATGHTRIALDTALDNATAQALYESEGYEVAARPAPNPRARRYLGASGFVGYVKRL